MSFNKLKCLIVEDEPAQIETLGGYLLETAEKRNCKLEFLVYQKCPPINEQIMSCQVCFLDIVLDENDNGMIYAGELRKKGFQNEIVFLTSYHKYALAGYSVQAFDYLLKPLDRKRLESCFIRLLQKQMKSKVCLQDKKSIFVYQTEDILYLESSGHEVIFHTLESRDTLRMPLSEIINTLPQQFFQIHRTIIVNMEHIRKINGNDLLLDNGELLPIGRKHMSELKTALIENVLGATTI